MGAETKYYIVKLSAILNQEFTIVNPPEAGRHSLRESQSLALAIYEDCQPLANFIKIWLRCIFAGKGGAFDNVAEDPIVTWLESEDFSRSIESCLIKISF